MTNLQASDLSGLKEANTIKVLHVDDDQSIQEITKLMLLDLDERFEIDDAPSVDEGLRKLKSKKYDVVVSDYDMPQKDGLQFLKVLHEQNNEIPFILFTGKGREEVAIKALNLGANGYINKQGNPETVYGELAYGIRTCFKHKKSDELLRKNQAELKAIVDNAPLGIATSDSNMRFKSANEAFCKIVGYSEDELQKRSFRDITYPKDITVSNNEMQELICGNIPYFSQEKRYVRKDGNVIDCKVIVSAIRDNEGKPVLFVAELEDITERKFVQDAIRRSEEKYRQLVESSNDGIFTIDLSAKVNWANNYGMKMLGYSDSDLPVSLLKLIPAKYLLKTMKLFYDGLRGKVVTDPFDLEVYTKSRERIPVSYKGTLLHDEEGKVTGVLGIIRNFQEKRKMEKSLVVSEDRFQDLVETTGEFIWETDSQGRYTYCSPQIEKIWGLKPEEMLGKTPFDMMPPRDKELALKLFGVKSGSPKPFRGFQTTACDNLCNLIFVETNGVPFFDDKGSLLGFRGVSRDVTKWKKAEEKLLEALAKTALREKEVSAFLDSTRAVLNNSDFAVSAKMIFDNCKNLIGATAGYVALLSDDGSENMVLFLDSGGLSCMVDASLPMPIRGLRETAYRTCKVVYENDFSKSDWMKFMPKGHVQLRNVMFVPLVVDGKAVGVMGLANKSGDFTERNALVGAGFGEYAAMALNNSWKLKSIEDHQKNLEILNEKLRVVGSLTRHDVANKLMSAESNLYLLRKRIGDNPDLAKYLDNMDSSLTSSERIFEFSRLYERIGAEKPSQENVFGCFNQAVALMPNLGGVEVVNECKGLVVVADSLLKQLFYNFIDNSLKHGEKVTQIRLHYTEDGKGVKLFYEDNGVGVHENNKSKLFEAGFTTGKGSGFGLYLVKKMMDVYGWTIIEEGEQGKGAKFIITIPRLSNYQKEDCQNLKGVFESDPIKGV